MTAPRLFASLDTRRFLRILGVIAGVALLLRLFVCGELAGTPGVASPVTASDMATYKQTAMEILKGNWPAFFYYQPFYYAVYLPVIYLLTMKSVWGVLLVQSLLGAATVWLTGMTTARVFGRRAGLVAAGLLAFARFPIFYTPFLLMATLQAFWMALLLYLAVAAWRRPVWWRWLALALVASVATLTRGNVLLLIPGLLALLGWRHRRRPLLAVGLAVGFVALVYLPQLPFAVRNYRHYGRWTGPSSAMDAVLALGNTPEAPPGGLHYPASYHEWMRLADRPGAERVPVLAQMRGWALAEPLQFLELKWRTFLLFWNRIEVPNNVSIEYHGAKSMLLKVPFLIGFGVIGALALFGMLLSWRWRSPPRLYLYFAVLAYCAGTVLFYILARFRLPVVPLLCVFAGNGAMVGIERFRRAAGEKGRQQRLVLLLGLVLAAFFVCAGFQLYQLRFETGVIRWLRPDGVQVELPDRVVCYDHGPLFPGVGGASLRDIPPEGTLLGKAFVLPSGLAVRQGTLRIPLVRSGPETEIPFMLKDCEQRGAPTWDRDWRGFEWLNIPVTLGTIEDGVVRITVGLDVKTGGGAVVFDQYRDHGRTLIGTPQGETVRSSEVAFELVLSKARDVVPSN
ncbi:MAG: hypothetical protein HN849_26220 [Victivallales bacterium]|nr:hypothetical protein [Victivallales bacterium]